MSITIIIIIINVNYKVNTIVIIVIIVFIVITIIIIIIIIIMTSFKIKKIHSYEEFNNCKTTEYNLLIYNFLTFILASIHFILVAAVLQTAGKILLEYSVNTMY